MVEDRPRITSLDGKSSIDRDSSAANILIILSFNLYAANCAIRTRARGYLVAGQTRSRFVIGLGSRRKPKARTLDGKATLLFTFRSVLHSKH